MIKEIKLIKIDNSQVLKLPKELISKYALGNNIEMEECPDGILIHAAKNKKLSWEDTCKEMAKDEKGEWNDWNALDIDGKKAKIAVDQIPTMSKKRLVKKQIN